MGHIITIIGATLPNFSPRETRNDVEKPGGARKNAAELEKN